MSVIAVHVVLLLVDLSDGLDAIQLLLFKLQALCDELIETNENLTDAFHNAGMAYYQLAQNKWKEIDGDRQRREEVLDLYRRALAYLERYRSLAPEASAKWAMPLYTIYLNLNMGTEFDEMEKIVNQLSGE